MRQFKWALIVAALTLAAGCGPAAPTLSGGKPVSHWVQALHDPDPKKREEAVEKLGNVGSADPAAYPALTGGAKRSESASSRRGDSWTRQGRRGREGGRAVVARSQRP